MSDIYVYKGKLWKPTFTFNYTGSPQKITLEPGEYLFVCNGANGGLCADSPCVNPAPHGGTSYGILDLKKTSDFYAVVGGNGGDGSKLSAGTGGYNGGANGGTAVSSEYSNGAGGGGASDVRLISPVDSETIVIEKARYNVPDEYQPIEYLESSYNGDQWIDTQFIHRTKTKFEFDMYTETSGSHHTYETPFGARNNTYNYNAYYMFSKFGGNAQAVYCRTGAETTNSNYPYGQRVHIETFFKNLDIYDETGSALITRITTSGTPDNGVCSITLFNLNRSSNVKTNLDGTATYFVGRLYNFIVSEEGELQHYFVPVRRKTSTYEFDYDVTDLEDGTIGSSGDDSSASRVRSKSFLRADEFRGTLSFEAYDINDNPLDLCISEYYIDDKSSTYLIDDGDWIGVGNTFTFTSQYTGYIRFILKYPEGTTNIDPADVKSLHISISNCNAGMYDIITDTFHANRSLTADFVCGNDTTFEDVVIQETIDTSTLSRIIVAGGAGGTAAQKGQDVGIPSYFGIGGGAVGGAVASNAQDSNNAKYADQISGYKFGSGMVPAPKTEIRNWGAEGAGGGGGGWYGGYASAASVMENSCCNGGGGSGYVLTEESYKPEWYEEYISNEYYFTYPCMTGGTSDNPSVIICKQRSSYNTGDKLIFPCIGDYEQYTLDIGNYLIKCWGGDGGPRYAISSTPRGGYAEGRLSLEEPTQIFVNVGGSGIRSTFDYQSSLMCIPSLAFNGGGPAPELNDIRSSFGGGGTDVRLLQNTLYHRLIVAGGAGGHGAGETAHNSFGGAGGGLSGGNGTGSYGSVPGPGTQTSSPQGSDVGGGFGYGGTGSTRGGTGFGGSGGGGWYGGSGCYPDSSSDDDRGGAGGSGYVLTEESYKPDEYMLGEEYYLTDTLLVTGDTAHRYGQSKVEIIAEEVHNQKMLCYDEEGTKTFNIETQSWEFISNTPPTSEDLNTYGVYLINSDKGLLDNYSVYIYDTGGSGINDCSFNVIPAKQTILVDEKTNNFVTDLILDGDIDEENVDISLASTHKYIDNESYAELIMNIDIKDIPKIDTKIYAVYAFTKGNAKEYHDPTPHPKPKTLEHIDLLSVGIGNSMPYRYKSYLGGFISDGQEAITSINSSISYEHNRNVYSAILCNDKIVRFTKLNLLTNTSTIIRDVSKTVLGNTYYGGFIVDDDFMYLTSSNYEDNRIWKIPLDPTDQNIETISTPDSNKSIVCYGKIDWYDDHTIVMWHRRRGIWLYDTIKNKWTEKPQGENKNDIRGDFAIGDKYLISTYYDSSTSGWIVDVENNQWYDMTETYYTFPDNEIKVVCYGDGKFYFAQKSYIYVMDEENIKNHLESGAEVNVKRIAASYGSSIPRTISYVNGLLYITLRSSNLLYIYDIKTDMFRSTLLEFTQLWDYPYRAGYHIPTTVDGGYFFIADLRLFVINLGDYAKYNMGYKFNQIQYIMNIDNIDKFTYDDRFVSFNDSYILIHTGDIIKPTIIVDENVYRVDISKTEYNKLISFTANISD